MSENLTDKQRAFIEAYLTHWNATRAALDAGYSAKTARVIGPENLSKPAIQSAIQARLAELKMSADEVLTRLTDHARASVASFLRVSGDGEFHGFDLSEDQPLHLIRRATSVKRRFKDESTEHSVTIELHDAQSALALLGKHHKLFTDKVEHTGANGQPLFKVYEKTDAFDPDDA